jgi:hypothetical protein
MPEGNPLAYLQALLGEEGQGPNVVPADEAGLIGSGFRGALSGGLPGEGAKLGVDSNVGALDKLLDIGGPEIFNLFRKLALAKQEARDPNKQGNVSDADVSAVGIQELIDALTAAQTQPEETGTAGDRSLLDKLLRRT